MSAPGSSYGSAEAWAGILSEYRCESVDEGRRCQLYRDHQGGHAHAAGTPTTNLPVHRWDSEQRWTEQPGYGMRWCCMFAA